MLNLLSYTCCESFPQFNHLFLNSGMYLFEKNYVFYIWLLWVFVAAHGLPLVCGLLVVASLIVEHGLWSRGSVVVAHWLLSCSEACEIFLDQRLNLRPLHWQVDSQPLDHHRSPCHVYFYTRKQFKIAFESIQFAVLVTNPNSHTKQFCVLLWFSFCCPVSSSAKWAITFLPLPLTLYDYQIALIYFKV